MTEQPQQSIDLQEKEKVKNQLKYIKADKKANIESGD